MKKIKALTVFLTLVTQTGVFFCYAQTVDSAKNLKEVEVLSNNVRKKIDSTAPAFRVDARQLVLNGTTDMGDVVRRLPGVTLRDYGGAGSLKTMSVRGQGAKHTSVVYDGAVVSDMQSGEIDLSKFSIDNVNYITLYTGENDDIFIPARASSTSSSLVISTFPTLTDDNREVKGDIIIKAGSFGFINPYVKFSKSLTNNFAVSTQGEFTHSDNCYPFKLTNGSLITTEKREHSQINTYRAEINMRLKGLNGIWMAKGYYYDNNRNLPGPVIYYVDGGNETLTERTWFIQGSYRGNLTDKLYLAALLKHNGSLINYNDKNGKYPGGERHDHYNQKEIYATGSLFYTMTDLLSFDYSVDWYVNTLTTYQPSDVRPKRNSYVQSLTCKLKSQKLTAIARFLWTIVDNRVQNGDKARNRNELSPSFSLSYRPIESENMFLRASYKDIFRMPTFNEAYFNNFGSINLNPEKARNLNMGLTWQINPYKRISEFSITADGYLNRVSNKIVAVPYNMFLWTMTNLGAVKITGFDLTLNSSLKISDGQFILMSANWSYQRAKTITSRYDPEWNKQVAYIPLNSGNGTLSWVNPWINLSVHTTASSSRYTTNTNLVSTRMPGYFETGVSLNKELKFMEKNVSLRGDLLNIFNKQYEVIARYPLPGRNFRITAKIEI